MASFLTDNCYCAGDLSTERLHVNQSLEAKNVKISNIEVEHIKTDVVQSDYVYSTEEVGSSHVDALNTLSLHNESINTWQGLIDNEYITIPSPPVPDPDISYSILPSFNKLREVNEYYVLDVAQSFEDKNVLLALMTKNQSTSVLFESTNGGASWTYLFATPHFMTNISPYHNASQANTFGCFGEGYVYNYILRGTHNEMSIVSLDYKHCLKSFPTITASGNSYIISYYNDTGTVCSNWNSLSAHAGCAGCVSGCQVRDQIYNITTSGTIVKFSIQNCVNNTYYETVSDVLVSSYYWTDIAYIESSDSIICISSNNKIALFRHEISMMSSVQSYINYPSSNPNVSLSYVIPWYGTVMFITNSNSNWKYLNDYYNGTADGDVTFTDIDDESIPSGLLLTYHDNNNGKILSMISGKAYFINSTNNTKPSVISSLLELFYPIGSVYISFSSTSPASIFGGTWKLIDNKFLYSTTSNDVNSTGGNSSHYHNLSDNGYACIATHRAGNFICREVTVPEWTSNIKMNGVEFVEYSNDQQWGQALRGITDNASSLPPYIKCYMWRRYA